MSPEIFYPMTFPELLSIVSSMTANLPDY